MTRTRFRVLIASTATLAITVVAVPQALAQPANDNFSNATVITSLPFSDSVDISAATTEPGEPTLCGPTNQTVWYSFTPSSNVSVRADTSGSEFTPTELGLYQQIGTGFSLAPIGCVFDGSPIQSLLQAGNTYFFQAGSFFAGASGNLHFNAQAVPAPANDSFANATAITNVPFIDNVDLAGVTTESGEPTPSCGSPPTGSAWYAFTPPATGSFTMTAPAFTFIVEYAAYTGSSLASLTETACHLADPFTFHATEGSTTYIQVGVFVGAGGPVQVRLDVAPEPVADMFVFPLNPSIFDTVGFASNSSDPGGVGFQSAEWDFGDGSTDTGCCPTHRYAADGDYTVELTVTTFDGRTASTSRVVHVRTHDVAIARFLAPMAASVGQTRTITVGISNHRYPEDVQVQLFRSVPGGFQQVGMLTGRVSVLPGNRTTTLNFSYTFTSDDASQGKVTFKAIATILDAQDALPGDNEAIAVPTKVT